MSDPKRGMLEKCFNHYADSIDGLGYKAREPLIEFLGITKGSVCRTLQTRKLPLGENRIKLQNFLKLQGYRVTELEKAPREIRNIGLLLAFGVTDISKIAQTIGLSESHTRKFLGGKSNASRAILRKIVEYTQRLQKDYEKEIEATQKKYSANATTTERGSPDPTILSLAQSNGHPSAAELGRSVSTLSKLIEASIPLAVAVMEHGTPEDRKMLREQTSGRGVFELKNLLGGMCSETARTKLKNNKGDMP